MGYHCRVLKALVSSFFLFCFFLSLSSSQAASSLSQGQSITDGQTITSPGGVFALGFFNTSKSAERYVGIWYNSISIGAVVWVANRDKPVADSSGILTIGSSGDLEVRDGSGDVLWSTNVTTSTESWNSSTAVLEDSGNLCLRKTDASNNSRKVWESFAHPTDTYLPGMRVELDLRTGENELFTSWKAADDPSPGNITMGMDPSGTAQIVIWEGGIKRWRSGQWNQQTFTGIANMRPLYLYGFKLSTDNDKGKMYISYTSFDSSSLLRFVIRWDGKEEQLKWNEGNQTWSVTWTQPTSECEIYGKCGAFGVCSDDGRSPNICNCLRGFEARSGEEWRNGDWRGGCVRRSELGCGRNESWVGEDGFVRVSGVKLPDSSDWVVVNGGREECEERCLGNCSCKAYAYTSGIGCLTWDVDLMDIRTFEDGGNDLYLRLAHSELGDESKISKKVLIVIVVLGAVFLSICGYGLWRWRSKLRGCWKKGKDKKIPMYDLRPSKELSAEFSGPYELGEAEQGKVPELTYFNFSCVAHATDNFSDENKLGQGGFGPVYKGMIPGGQEIAVKRLSKTSGQGLEEFKNEVALIAKLQHRNLVRILGCCIQGEERILLYEYMPNKSLDFFIFDSTRQVLIDWTKRFSIIEGIARGLLYLHRDSRLRIIHRDLKASNILLDEEMSPKISDFGMARIFGGNQNHANTNRVVGTYGYMSPEYAMEGLFSIKSDVYSFGVLILEIISGKKNNSTYRHGDDTFHLLGHAWKLWNEDRGTELIDPSLGNSYSLREVLRCINVGLLCVQDHAADRPNMSTVVLMLEGESRSHPHPKPPTYSVGHSKEIESLHTSERYSSNDATISMFFGR